MVIVARADRLPNVRCKLGDSYFHIEPFLNRKTCEVATLPVFSHTRDQSHFSPGVCALGPTTWVKMSVFRNLDVGKGSFKPGDLPLLTELLIILEITGLSQISQLPQRDGQHRKIKVPGGL